MRHNQATSPASSTEDRRNVKAKSKRCVSGLIRRSANAAVVGRRDPTESGLGLPRLVTVDRARSGPSNADLSAAGGTERRAWRSRASDGVGHGECQYSHSCRRNWSHQLLRCRDGYHVMHAVAQRNACPVQHTRPGSDTPAPAGKQECGLGGRGIRQLNYTVGATA